MVIDKYKILFLFVIIMCNSLYSAPPPTINVLRQISPDTIYHSTSPNLPNYTTVTLKIAATDQATPIDYLLLTDNTTSMGTRSAGDRDWVNPNRIQAVYNACIILIDSCVKDNDRIALIRFYRHSDTIFNFTSIADDSGFIHTKALIDSFISGTSDNTALYDGLYNAIEYMQNYKRPNVQPVIIALTDGGDNASSHSYTDPFNLLKNIPETERPIMFTINVGDSIGIMPMKSYADVSGGKWYYTDGGIELTDIFIDISKSLAQTIAKEVDPLDNPMLVDVLGPDIHYIGGSFTDTLGNKNVHSCSVDSSGQYHKMKVSIDEIDLGDTIECIYNICAYLSQPPSSLTIMRTTNPPYHVNDTINFSRAYYIQADSTVKTITFSSPDYLYVLYNEPYIENNKDISNILLSLENDPNPFNPSTSITFYLPNKIFVTLKIYDIFGNKIKTLINEQRNMGIQKVIFEANNLPSGIYIAKLKVRKQIHTKRIILMK